MRSMGMLEVIVDKYLRYLMDKTYYPFSWKSLARIYIS